MPNKTKKQDAIHKIPLVQTWILVIQICVCRYTRDIFSDVLPDISSDILSDISSDILFDIFLTYLLPFFLTNLLTLFLMTNLLTYLSDILSDISFAILSDLSFDIISDISSDITCKNYWNLAKHVASLPEHRWVQRLLSWHPFGTRRVGRPRNTWDSKLDAYCRYANLGYWRDAALDDSLWNSHLGSFVDFCRM